MATPVRTAIYTRKSHEDGLEQDFNSLDAQRTAAENFIASHKGEGWILVDTRYDDGGYSGGTLERPALQRLMQDIEAGLIDCVVVYKIDRLSRSLLDFAKLIDVFDKHQVSFVSLTQSFNTATSMGRLTLNVLLSFAQYERELTGERIRDKFALSRQKGLWMGGNLPLGYDLMGRKLIINATEATLIQHIYDRFIALGSLTQLTHELNRAGYTTKVWIAATARRCGGQPFKKTTVRRILANPLYKGSVAHKGRVYDGQHEAIVTAECWQRAQEIFQSPASTRARDSSRKTPALLKGLLRCGQCGTAMTPTFTKRGQRLYRYYVCSKLNRGAIERCTVGYLAAGEIEGLVQAQLLKMLAAPEIVAQTLDILKHEADIAPPTIIEAFHNLTALWDELFPYEQERLCKLLIETIVVHATGVDLELRTHGIKSLMEELRGDSEEKSTRRA